MVLVTKYSPDVVLLSSMAALAAASALSFPVMP